MNRRVLIADDEPEICQLLASGLARKGFMVAWRTTAGEVLDLLATESFDVVVTDVHMPGMSGLELCERIAERQPALPVLVMSSFGGENMNAAASRAGARGFLEKPFEIMDLHEALDSVLLAGQLSRAG
jgi:DNA-binding NtrC family response regulator